MEGEATVSKNFIEQEIDKDLAEGKMFFSITYGKNLMGSHASQLSPEDSWKIILFIKELQKEHAAGADTASN